MFESELNELQESGLRIIDLVEKWAPNVIEAIILAMLIYIAGRWFIKIIRKLIDKAMTRRNVEVSLRKFINSLIKWVLNVILFILVITQLGIQTSTFVAIIGAAGLAIGLSLQGSLSNFAGGILILTLKPFRIGDYIESSTGISGNVLEIDIFNTKLNTPQNQLVFVPNGALSNSNITNYTQMGSRRTWFNIGISYDADLYKVKEILMDVANNDPDAFKEPAPQVVITELGSNAINVSVRVTASTGKFSEMQERLMINCKSVLEAAKIEIFPPQNINIKKLE